MDNKDKANTTNISPPITIEGNNNNITINYYY